MGQERFAGESAQNSEQKCLCVLVMDVSGSMRGTPIDELNTGLQSFFSEILEGGNGIAETLRDQLEISLIQFDEAVKIIRDPKLLDDGETAPVLFERGSTTNTVAALREAIKLVDDRKAFYKATGQDYLRPWIILMTDGEPYPYIDSDVNEISEIVKRDVMDKRYMMVGLGVQGANMQILSRMSGVQKDDSQKPSGVVFPLQGTKFTAFFSWLSNSMSTLSKSKEGDKVDISKGIADFAGFVV